MAEQVVPRKATTRREQKLQLQRVVAYFLLSLFVVNTLSVLTVIFLVGFEKMKLSETLILTLLAETVAQAAAIFFSVTKAVFSR